MPRRPGSSPLTRGKPVVIQETARDVGLIPAHAGKTTSLRRSFLTGWAHPRSRGENAAASAASLTMRGSSPLTRGKPVNEVPERLALGLIPAHAGKTSRPSSVSSPQRAHPRSRGENLPHARAAPPPGGSSPLTRGKHFRACEQRPCARLIPAHAGKTRRPKLHCWPLAAHPRSRGENCDFSFDAFMAAGSSPLTRGKPSSLTLRPRTTRLIPAHAGKTSTPTPICCARLAHPRSRGENSRPMRSAATLMGSSPLTRGKPRPRGGHSRRDGLIPAHAGKTDHTVAIR